MGSSSESKPGGFTVNDRRLFRGNDPVEGDTPNRQDAGPRAEAPGAAAEPPPQRESKGSSTPREDRAPGAPAAPSTDFPSFVLSLASSALMHLGEIEHPQTGRPQKDLALARHSIDILIMLREKTRGNLTPPEQNLLENLLHDLQLRFVEANRGA